VDEFGGRRNRGSHSDVRRSHRAEQVLNFSNFLQFSVADFRSEFHEAGFVAFDYEAAALGQMKNLAEPPQTVFVTPVVRLRESHSIFKRRYQCQTSQLKPKLIQTKLAITNVIRSATFQTEPAACTSWSIHEVRDALDARGSNGSKRAEDRSVPERFLRSQTHVAFNGSSVR